MAATGSPTRTSRRGTPREVFAWAMYDWANSAWSTILITVVVFYLTTVVVPSDWGPWFYGNGVGVSMFIAALLSPVLGALADARATKRFWLAITALGGAGAAILMGVVPVQPAWIALALFFIANLGFELSYGICNGFLPEISDDETVNRVSAWGFGAGYVGGGLALALALAVLMKGDLFGLPAGDYLTGDYNATHDGEFAVAVPPGKYDVTLTLGNPADAAPAGEYQVDGNPPETFAAARGEALKRSTQVDVTDAIRIKLKSDASSAAAPIMALAIQQVGGPFAAKFDFGTLGSPAESGYIGVNGDVKWESHPLPVEEKKPPRELTYGWQKGDIASVDAVNPIRMRIALLIGGVWWAVFSLPAIFFLRDKVQPRAQQETLLQSARGAFAQVGNTLKHVRLYPTLAIFLLGFLFFNDGMQTVISQASVFAQKELKMTTVDLVPLILMIQFVSLPGALFVGWLSDKIGQKPTLLLTLAVWIGLVGSAFFVTTKGQFWIMGFVLALVMGGAQSVSRAIMGRMTPETRAAEFMGFFNFSGKATSVFGPMLFANTYKATNSAHWAILSLLVFFILGTLLVLPVNIAKGQQEALQ